MTAVQHKASLHERSVQAIAAGEVTKRRRGRGPTRTRRVLESRDRQVDPMVWKLVRDTGIDHLCVEVVNEHNIIIWNHRGPWPE